MDFNTPEARHVKDLLARYVDMKEIDLAPNDADRFDFGDVMYGEDAVLKLVPGDHIAVLVEGVNIYHHGIFLGKQEDGETSLVDNNTGTNIRVRPWKDFGREYRAVPYLYRLKYPDPTQERRAVALKVALFLAENAQDVVNYNLVTANCENFATFCWTRQWCDLTIASVLAQSNIVGSPGGDRGLDKFHPKMCSKVH